jgi:asparagine synthase (glutamine-hydrolysing)
LRKGVSKYILKRLSSKILPDVIRLRRKMGFGAPIDHWLRGELKDLAYKILLGKKGAERPYFNPSYIKVLLDEHVSGKLNHSTRIWTLLCFELWHRIFIDNGDVRNPSLDLLSL